MSCAEQLYGASASFAKLGSISCSFTAGLDWSVHPDTPVDVGYVQCRETLESAVQAS